MVYTDNGKLRVVYGDYVLGVHGKGFDYTFSYAQGGLESIVKNGYEWLYRCPNHVKHRVFALLFHIDYTII